MQKFKLLAQKAQKKVLDADSVVDASFSTNSELAPHDLSDVPVPLQSSGASTDSPVASSGPKVGFSLQFSFKDLMSRKQRLSRLQGMSHASGRRKLEGYVES